jgi:type I restriction enzyme R subunit
MVNANPDLAAANSKYVMRITGDNDEGKAQLDNFIDPEQTYPVIACTSRLMSTGVDAQTCQLIVLDRRINSMTEFKQIIGRGTRINEDYGKFYFTIMDFRRATALFADPDFDGDPVQVYEPGPADPPLPLEVPADPLAPPEEPSLDDLAHDPSQDETGPDGSGEGPNPPPTRYVVDNVPVRIVLERVQYLDENGKLITESLTDYTRRAVRKHYASLNEFLTVWNDAARKQVILDELASQGVFLDELSDQIGKDFDPFDLVCHIAFDRPPLTRRERAEKVKKRDIFGKYEGKARAVLEALLEKYQDVGIQSLESLEILKVTPLRNFGTPVEIVSAFGGKPAYLAALRELEMELYREAA